MEMSSPGTARSWAGNHGSEDIPGDLLWLGALLVCADKLFIMKVRILELRSFFSERDNTEPL